MYLLSLFLLLLMPLKMPPTINPYPIYCGPNVEHLAPFAETEIDLETDGRPLITVDMNGYKTPLFLNTSCEAYPLSFTAEQIAKMQLDDIGTTIIYVDSDGIPHEAKQYLCPTVTMDTWTFFNRVGVEELLDESIGQVGLSFFHPFLVLIDYPQRRFMTAHDKSFFAKRGYALDRWTAMPLLEEEGVNYIEVLVNGQLMKAHLSTGFTDIVVTACEISNPIEITIGNIPMGQFKAQSYPMTEPGNMDIILGNPFFFRRPICIDSANKMVYIGKELVY